MEGAATCEFLSSEIAVPDSLYIIGTTEMVSKYEPRERDRFTDAS